LSRDYNPQLSIDNYQYVDDHGLIIIDYQLATINQLSRDLVGGIPTPLKNMSSSVGMMTFPIYGNIIQMFQTTNQYITIIFPLLLVYTLLTTINHHY